MGSKWHLSTSGLFDRTSEVQESTGRLSSHASSWQVCMRDLGIPYLVCHTVHSSRNRCQIPWGGWRGRASCHSLPRGQTATGRSYLETGLRGGWSAVLPMEKAQRLGRGGCAWRRLNLCGSEGKCRGTMFLGVIISRRSYGAKLYQKKKKKTKYSLG